MEYYGLIKVRNTETIVSSTPDPAASTTHQGKRRANRVMSGGHGLVPCDSNSNRGWQRFVSGRILERRLTDR